MGVLAAALALAVALAGCYSPSLRDCTVSCAREGDCAQGQVCGSDGLCAAPDVAGRCAGAAPVDARPPELPDAPLPVDAGVAIDAAPPPDAPPANVALRIQIDGKGTVIVDGRSACSSSGPQRGDCTFDVTRGVAITVRAVQFPGDQPFSSWTSATCRGSDPMCTFTPMAATSLMARFGKMGGP